ncbi:flagellin FliC [Sphingomonas sp. CGMCC 1.13654]|uniref:Flagellin n=1 Tax=Sphingomonas chungangi TaxID=2683589 RepID=A0A838L681_9SPHN|nr:flagellin [Sphingomonas chungangi]MBA2933088.1 flagellin FliC [Sphingomonas chungangi]MVW56708.1 flagellin FliC [Sphingomonas chungangi]
MTVINTNSAAMRAQNGTRLANMELQTAMARLSSGKRINNASDDAAGLAISNSMTSQINGMNQAISNANDGISMAQTADGALDEVTSMLQRIRELAVQSASGTYSDDDRTNMQAEVGLLTQQITSSLTGTTFNGVNLFDGSAGGGTGTVSIQVGSDAGNTIGLDFSQIADTTAATSVATVADANDAMTSVDAQLKVVDTARAKLGAAESRMNSVVNSLTANVTNLTDAKSRISDADFSVETTNLAKAQILSQAATAMLAQANQTPQGVMKLLGN